MESSQQEFYNEHPDYMAIRQRSGRVWDKYRDDVLHFKLKYLASLVSAIEYRSILEVGCATGFLLQSFPGQKGIERFGVDVSSESIAAARQACPGVEFFAAQR